MEYLNSVEFANKLSGANKKWVTQTTNTQLKKYGNEDIFSVKVDTYNGTIEVQLGESWGVFKKEKWGERKGQWVRDYGNLYKEDKVTKCVNELASKYQWCE